MKDSEILASKIVLLRSQKKITQAQLANLMDVTEITVNRWENGVSLPRLQQIFKLSELSGHPVSWFFCETCREPQRPNIIESAMDELNELGKSKVLDYLNDLKEIPKYQKKK